MICATSPARTGIDWVEVWNAFKAEVEDKTQPECRSCGICHERAPWHPYCLMGRRFFHWRMAREE